MITAEGSNVVVFDVLEHLQDLCVKDIAKVPNTLIDIMDNKKNSAQDRIQAVGMFTYIATFNSTNNMFSEAPFKIQLVGKSPKNNEANKRN